MIWKKWRNIGKWQKGDEKRVGEEKRKEAVKPKLLTKNEVSISECQGYPVLDIMLS